MLIIRKNPKLGNFVHFEHGGEASAAGFERVESGFDEAGQPILIDGDPLYSVDWQEGWGVPPTEQDLADWPEPEPEANPVTDVKRMAALFAQAQVAAPAALNQLKGTVWAALVAGGMAQDEATAAGVALVLLHGPLLAAFEAAGGHPLAAQALYDAIASEPSRQALSWLSDEILAIFSAALTPGK